MRVSLFQRRTARVRRAVLHCRSTIVDNPDQSLSVTEIANRFEIPPHSVEGILAY
jgi:hypothetical protein